MNILKESSCLQLNVLMKNKVINLVVLFITLGLVIFFTLKDDFTGIINELKKVNILIVLIAISLYFLSLFVKSISIYKFINLKNKYNLYKTYILVIIANFMNDITPLQTGGQPYEIYALKKGKIRITDSSKAIMKDAISYQIALILLALISIITNYKYLKLINIQTKILMSGGLIANVLVLSLFLSLIFGEGFVNKISNIIIRRKPDKKEKIEDALNNFYSSTNELKKKKTLFIYCILINMIHLILLYLIPYVVLKSFNIQIPLISSITLTSLVMLIGNFVPLPGGVGGIEYGFMQLFGILVISKALPGAMIIWRFSTFVMCLIVGFILLLIKKGSDNK